MRRITQEDVRCCTVDIEDLVDWTNEVIDEVDKLNEQKKENERIFARILALENTLTTHTHLLEGGMPSRAE